ncbi:hypothetical protein P3T36_003186 [Kitasatospora sp. MAP12-15]|uniref:hypothetical protein n=1 Tax=unclassified Kitasatospora TaxID=2633591 RepID=UPI002475D3A3|nr:hypothetical protein [Kitasatospora sp. MAP12-44]MDH6111162.1 hypothetical protein [Kitasatospora sp. MAP12-44]
MSTTTPLNGLPIPQETDPADVPTAFANFAGAVDSRLVMRFASTTARDLVITSPIAGMIAYVGNGFTYYTGSAWVLMQDLPFALYQQTVAQNVANLTPTAMTFPAPVFDGSSGYNAANPTRYTPTVSGYYQVNGQISYAPNITGGRCLNLMKNGNVIFGQQAASAIPTTYYNATVAVSAVAYFNGTTDYLEIYAHQNSGATLATVPSATQLSVLRVHT